MTQLTLSVKVDVKAKANSFFTRELLENRLSELEKLRNVGDQGVLDEIRYLETVKVKKGWTGENSTSNGD